MHDKKLQLMRQILQVTIKLLHLVAHDILFNNLKYEAMADGRCDVWLHEFRNQEVNTNFIVWIGAHWMRWR